MEAGEDGSELIGQLTALMEQLTRGVGLEGIPQELVEAQRADRQRQKEEEDRRVAEAASAAANAPPERVWLDAVLPSISCLSCIDEMLHTGEDLCPRCRREGRTGDGDLPLVVTARGATDNATRAAKSAPETTADSCRGCTLLAIANSRQHRNSARHEIQILGGRADDRPLDRARTGARDGCGCLGRRR